MRERVWLESSGGVVSKVRLVDREHIPLGFIVISVLCVFWQVRSMSYVLWDDDLLIADNAILRMPFIDAVKAAFGGYYNGDYMPLTLMSYWCEVRFAGFQPSVQHLSNLFLHVVNVLLCWVWLKRIIKDPRIIWAAVGIFAIHPLQVETVAWISERKGLLATCFYLLSLISYEKSNRTNTRRFGWVTLYLGFYVLAVLSKANGIFLPLWVALSDCLRERRAIPRKWPVHVVALVLVGGAVILRVHAYASAVPQLSAVMLTPERVLGWPGMIWAVLGFYVQAFFWPLDLSIIYPSYQSSGGWGNYQLTGAIFVIAVLSILFIKRLREQILWIIFLLLSLAPVMNLVPRINFVNDRYAYLPLIAMTILVIEVAKNLGSAVTRSLSLSMGLLRHLLLPTMALLLMLMMIASHGRAQVWHDNLSLWGDTVKKVPASSLAFNNLGQAYQERGDIAKAIEQFQKSLALADPYLANLATNNLATIYSSRQYPDYFNLPYAKSLLEEGITKVARPDDSLVLRYNLALVYLQMGDAINGRKILDSLRLAIEQSSNQRYRFLLARVTDLQTRLEGVP
ncbi:MAG: tetratricopeptide repeat protein [Deltaproteobacteria bacterium]|nr:tetratricopeptide repeat protein [Deltaproteobacteria bacterium]